MLEFTDVKISKNPCKTGDKIVISVGIRETVDFPFDFPFDFPVSWTGTALPEGAK